MITISGTPKASGTFAYSIPLTGGCGSVNATGTITVSPASVGGTIAGSATVCSGSNSGTLTLSGHTGSVVKWQSSTNNGSTWSDVSNTTTSQSYTNLTTTTQYRAVVQSGSCASATTSAVTITVYDALLSGSISGNQTMCSGVVPDSIVNTVLPTGGNGIIHINGKVHLIIVLGRIFLDKLPRIIILEL